MRRFVRLLSAAPLFLGVAGCSSNGPAIDLGVAGRNGRGRTAPLATHFEPIPTPLGGRGLGKVGHRLAAVTLADSVFRHWGWRLALADSASAKIQTAWLYLPRGNFQPGIGSQCESGSFTAVRFTLSASDSGSAPSEFILRAEAMIFTGTPTAEAERLARGTFTRVGTDLAAALRTADSRPDEYGPVVNRRWGQASVDALGNTAICGGRGH